MPLHRWFVPPHLYSDDDKAAIAKAITSCYPTLPPFYVVVLFVDIQENSYFVGGEKNNNFVRIGIEHLARHFSEWVEALCLKDWNLLIATCSDVAKRVFMNRYEASIEPFTKGRGIDWEVQISECDVSVQSLVTYATDIFLHLPACFVEREWNATSHA